MFAFKLMITSAAMAIAAQGSATTIAANALNTDAIAFGTREGVENMDLSPDGRQAIFVGPGPGRSTIAYHVDIGAGATKPILSAHGNPETLRWCAFASNSRIACSFTAIVDDGAHLLPASRMISLNTDGSDIKELGQRASDHDVGYRQHGGSVIDWLPGSDDHVLMSRVYLPEGFKPVATNVTRTKQGLGVVKINVRTLKAETVEAPRNAVTTYMSDGRGNVRVLGIAEFKGEAQMTGRVKYLYRTQGSRDWKDLTPYQKDEFQPLAVDATSNSVYALRKRDGRYALSRVTLTDPVGEVIVATHPRVDIDDVVQSGDGQRVIGYTYADDRRRTVYFDPEYKALQASLGRALKTQSLINFSGASEDGTKTLLFAGSDNDPGRYLLFDKTAKSLGELLPVRPALKGRTLASVQSITYKAADGAMVPAYLTLPAGKEAKGLPAVVVPHGGPSSRDEWGFDWLAQFFAARGYAVIQPNYRGSAGYGDDWLGENAFQNWKTAIGDISASARHLVAQGIADPQKLAVAGWSYGGYAALQSAAVEPSLYKAVIAIAPVTDLDLLKQEARDYTSGLMVRDFVGSGSHIAEGSPLKRAAAIKAPVLLVHGSLDINVRDRHSVRMDQALRSNGGRSELLHFKGLDHQLADSDARALMLSKAGALLDSTIGR